MAAYRCCVGIHYGHHHSLHWDFLDLGEPRCHLQICGHSRPAADHNSPHVPVWLHLVDHRQQLVSFLDRLLVLKRC